MLTSEWRSAGLPLSLMALLLLVMLPVSTSLAASASATASIFVTILPIEGSAQQTLHIMPNQLSLSRNEYGKITVSNHSGQHHDINVDVTPTSVKGCRLNYTPKHVVLNDGQRQVFRVFYTADDDGGCNATFSFHIEYGRNNTQSIEVKCK